MNQTYVLGDPSKNGLAVTSMVIGIIGLVCLLFFPVFFIPIIGIFIGLFLDLLILVSSIVGLVLGIKGRRSENRGMAVAGIVLCSIVLVIYCIPVIILLGILFFGVSLFGGLGITSLFM